MQGFYGGKSQWEGNREAARGAGRELEGHQTPSVKGGRDWAHVSQVALQLKEDSLQQGFGSVRESLRQS